MAVDDINNINSVLTTVLQGQTRTTVSLATSPLNLVKNPVAVAVAATENLTPAQQTALLGNEAVQILSSEPSAQPDPLLANGTTFDATTVLESEGLSPAQQAALAVNETVQTALETQNLTSTQQAALAVNQATQPLAAAQAPAETAIPAAAEVEVVGQAAPSGPGEATTAAGTAAGVATPEAATAATGAAIPVVTTTTPAVTATVTREVPSPAQPAVAQPIPYASAFVVYEVRNPTPPPGEPGPIRRDIHPAVPIGRVRRVDPLVLRQEWEKRKRNRRHEGGHPGGELAASRPPLAEKTIREIIRQANDDLAASGVPLHLVLARTAEGFALDVYECLDEAMCEMTQEIPLDFKDLWTVLDNIEHETGIIVNIKT